MMSAASAVVPDAREELTEQASAKAASVCKNAEETAFSISPGKPSPSMMNLGKLLHTKSAACFPPCPSKT
jgi:hypothetical protein